MKKRTKFHKVAITVYGIGTALGCIGIWIAAYKTGDGVLALITIFAIVLWLSELGNYLSREPN